MRNSLLVLLIMAGVQATSAQTPASLINDYQRQIRSDETRMRVELKVTDPILFSMIDTLGRYCVDPKFNITQQIQNLQGLERFLIKIKSKEEIRSGQCYNLLMFYFSIIDWRKEGNYYDNLNSYSSFAMKCASFFAEDSTGIKFISKHGQDYPDDILANAEQISDNIRYRTVIENAIIKDPDFAKRYFFSENIVSYYAANSKRRDIRGIYDIFDSYGSKSKAYILYEAIRRNQMTAQMADSIARDPKAMIVQMVRVLEIKNPVAVKSLIKEMDYRSTEWVRQSTYWDGATVAENFNKFSTDEKLAVLIFGYRECNPELLDLYITLLHKSDLSSVSTALLDNLSNGGLPAFLHFLDKEEKLPKLLSGFSDVNKEKLSQMLATDETNDGEPLSLESLSKKGVMKHEIEEPNPSKSALILSDIKPIATKTIQPPQNNISEVKSMLPALAPAKEISIEDLLASVEPIHIPLSDSSRDILGLKKNIYMALQDISAFIQKPYAKDLLLYAATVEPDEVLKKVDMYKGKYWSKDILEEATLNAPLSAKRYFNNTSHPVSVILGLSRDSIIRKFMQLSVEAKYESKPFLLFDEMASDCLSLTDASALCRDNNSLFKELMGIASQKNYIGRYNIEREMNYYALRYIRSINDKVDLPEKERFASLENLSCDEIYYLMVYGREEVFDATFQGLFTRFQTKCSASGYWNAARFVSLPHYRSFIAMCAAYGKLDIFLSLFPASDQTILLTTFASSLDKERDALSDAATVAETITNTSNNTVLQVLQNTIKASYMHLELVQDYNGMAIYGILSALFKEKAVSDKKWFAVMAKKYKTGSLTTLSNAVLMSQGIFVERMYFYDDQDGRDSYKNFIATFSASPYWRLDEYFSYAKVTSIGGKKIEIYANKPELEESGDREISAIIRGNNYAIGGIVHRGHSFHTEATLARVPAATRFIFVGSCGGFYKINTALSRAPDAQVISTRQIGIKQINDPIIFSFNEYVRQGKDINWKIFWDEMSAKLGKNRLFNDYVPPHKNLESLFVRAYYQIMSNE